MDLELQLQRKTWQDGPWYGKGAVFLVHHVDCNDKRITGLVMSLRSIASQFLRQRILPLRWHYRLRQNSC